MDIEEKHDSSNSSGHLDSPLAIYYKKKPDASVKEIQRRSNYFCFEFPFEEEEHMYIYGSKKSALYTASIAYFFGFAAVVAIAASSEKLKDSFNDISETKFAVLLAIPNLSGSILRIPFSAWTDLIGARKPILALLTISVFGLLGLTIVGWTIYPDFNDSHYWLLCFLGFCSGAGIGTFSPGVAQISSWYPKDNQGTPLALYGGFGATAPGIFSILMAIILGSTNSDSNLGPAYLTWFLVSLIGLFVYYNFGYDSWFFQYFNAGYDEFTAKEKAIEKGQEIISNRNIKQSLRQTISMTQVKILIALYFTCFGGFLALSTWLPTYWKEYHETGTFLTLEVSLLLNALFIFTGAGFRAIGGKLSDKYSGETITYVASGIIILGSIFFELAGNDSVGIVLALIGMIIIGSGMGMMSASVFKLVPKVSNMVGGVSGWTGGLGALGGFVIPPCLGLIVDEVGDNGFSLGYLIFSFLGIVCLFLMRYFISLTPNKIIIYNKQNQNQLA